MESSLQKRLSQRMAELGMNAYQTAKKAGLGDSFVRDILRGKTRSPSAENLSKLANALETTAEYFTGIGDHKTSGSLGDIEGLSVEGSIQAGNWLDMSVMDFDEREIIPVARDPRFPNARQYALLVRGDSMNLEYQDGEFVTLVDFTDAGLGKKAGQIVHVERHDGDLVEMTLKELRRDGEEWVLYPKSTNDRHKPIRLNGNEGTEVVIKGVVIGSYKRRKI